MSVVIRFLETILLSVYWELAKINSMFSTVNLQHEVEMYYIHMFLQLTIFNIRLKIPFFSHRSAHGTHPPPPLSDISTFY